MARRRAEPGVDRRQQILDAALDVFAEVGFDGATTKQIAAQADVTQGLIYFYFPEGKEELFRAAFEAQATIALAELELDAAERTEPPDVLLPRVLARFIRVMSEPRLTNLLRLMGRAALTEHHALRPGADARKVFRELASGLAASLRTYLDEQVARGNARMPDSAIAADMILCTIGMAMIQRAKGTGNYAALSPEDLANRLCGIYLRGILPTASDTPTGADAALV